MTKHNTARNNDEQKSLRLQMGNKTVMAFTFGKCNPVAQLALGSLFSLRLCLR